MSRLATDARRFYLAMIRLLPDFCEPGLRWIATQIRVVRRALRVGGRRALRVGGRIIRRVSVWVRSRLRGLWIRSAVVRALLMPLRSAGYSSSIRRPLHWARARIPIVERLIPPMIRIQGPGPLILVDCRGTDNHRAKQVVSAAGVGATWRALMVVDDPDIAILREAGLVYEYLPSDTQAYSGSRTTAEFITGQRMGRFRSNYHTDRMTTLDDLAATLTSVTTLPGHGAEVSAHTSTTDGLR